MRGALNRERRMRAKLGATLLALLLSLGVVVGGPTAPAQAYCTNSGWKWNSRTVPIQGNINEWWQISRDAFGYSANQWTSVSPSPLAFSSISWVSYPSEVAPATTIDRLRFFEDYGTPAMVYDTSYWTSGHSTATLRMSSNTAKWTWNNGGHGVPGPNGSIYVDVGTVAVHEMGHLIGLLHPRECGAPTTAELNAVMTAQFGSLRRVLTTDDKNGLNSLGY